MFLEIMCLPSLQVQSIPVQYSGIYWAAQLQGGFQCFCASSAVCAALGRYVKYKQFNNKVVYFSLFCFRLIFCRRENCTAGYGTGAREEVIVNDLYSNISVYSGSQLIFCTIIRIISVHHPTLLRESKSNKKKNSKNLLNDNQ